VDDKKIIDLFLARSEEAIAETDKKYGGYLKKIAYNVLSSREDAEECVNDTFAKAWESIPPVIPLCLSAFLGRIVRNFAINRYLKEKADKRKSNSDLVFEELDYILPDPSDGRSIADEISLKAAIESFLGRLDPEMRIIFVKRYWYMQSLKDIARDMQISESKVKVSLMRTRRKLKARLEEEEIYF